MAQHIEVVGGLGSLVLLAAAFGVILVARPAPALPPLEVALVDDSGSLLVLPLQVRMSAQTALTVVVRSPSGAASTASLTLRGDGIQDWRSGTFQPTTAWTTLAVPIGSLRTGRLDAVVDVRGDHGDVQLPIQLVVAP